MKKENIDEEISWCDLIEPYHGEWVTLTRDTKKVLSHSKYRKVAIKQARARGVEYPFIVKSPFEWW